MRNFALIFRLILKNVTARKLSASGKKKLPSYVINLIFSAMFAALIGCMIAIFVVTTKLPLGTFAFLVAALLGFSQLFSVLYALRGVLGVLFSSNDAAFYGAMPIRPSSVFFAKYLIAYIQVLEMTGPIFLTGALAGGIAYAVTIGGVTAGYFVGIFVLAALSPLLPLFIITLISMPLNYIGSFLKGRAGLKSVLSILVYVLAMGAYFAVMLTLNANGADVNSTLGAIATAMYPDRTAVELILGIDPMINALIAVGSVLAMILLTLLLSALFYRRIITKRLEVPAESRGERASFKQRRLTYALLKKDIVSVFRQPQLAMAHFANLVMSPILFILMYFTTYAATTDSVQELQEGMAMGFLIMYSLIFLGATNQFAMLAFTREGGSFYLSRSLPIGAKACIREKLLLSNLVADGFLLVNCVIAAALYRVNIVNVIIAFIVIGATIFGVSALYIYEDLKNGNVNWSTRDELNAVSQNNRGTMGSVFVVTAAGIVEFVLAIFVKALGSAFSSDIAAYAIFWSLCAAVAIGFVAVGVYLLKQRGEALYETLSERAFTGKLRRNRFRGFGKGMGGKGFGGGLLNG